MADPTDPLSAISPSASPSSVSPLLAAPHTSSCQSSYPGFHRLLFSHDLVTGWYKGSVRFGLVRLIHGEEEESDSAEDGVHGSSDTESIAEQSRARPVHRDYVRVQWYPEGVKQDVKETKLKLEDRSVVPRDVVRRMSPTDSQCGTVIDVDIECAVKLVGTNHALFPINSRELQHIWPFMYGDYIAFDCWLGKVYDLKNQIILKLSNGARCSMSTEDGSKLYDVCPHVSDSGLFFDDSYGFYPGQVLIGPSKVFSNVQWLSGIKPVLSKKSKFRVVVEEVQVVELKVTWITKSFCPGGTDSINPPPSVINQENLSRVKRLSAYDHAQRQLGERCLYTVPSKVELTKIVSEGSEGNSVFPEGTFSLKVKKLQKKQTLKAVSGLADSEEQQAEDKTLTNKCLGIKKPDQQLKTESEGGTVCGHIHKNSPSSNGPVNIVAKDYRSEHLEKDNKLSIACHIPLVLKKECPKCSKDNEVQQLEQDADEAVDDTDDTSSVTSSASSTASSQSGSTGRKKSIPLSIKNLKRKHKKKKTKQSRELNPGDRVAVEVVSTMTSAKVMWQDGTVEANIRSNELFPVHHLDNNEFCPGDFVVDKRVHMAQDPGIYGVIQSSDHIGRTCVMKWLKLQPSGSDVELIRKEEDVSVYDIADHPDFRFRTTDTVIRIGNTESGGHPKNDAPSVGQVSCVDIDGKVEVIWADESRTIVLPQHLYDVESEIEESDYDSVDVSSSGASSDEWEDESDSWETDNGLTEEDHTKKDGSAVGPEPEQHHVTVPVQEDLVQGAAAATSSSTSSAALEKSVRDSTSKGCRELKEAIKILESLRNMTVEQLLTGSPTSPVVEPEKPTREKKFLDDIKKLQETLKKTLDNVAIVEEQKMEAVVEMEKEEEKTDAQTPVKSEWPSDTPVLCQQSGGRPGVTFTSAKGEVFSILESSPDTHSFKKMEFQPAEAKKFFSTVRKEMALLATSLPDGIMVKTFEDRMDLFSALIKGPTRTPYEDGLFLFDIQLPNIYPAVPPLFRYLSQCSGRLNPNLYDNGKVCVSLLGTWIGKGTERWTSKSSLLQVLISIQGLILVNEPYYNEAGFDSDRGLQEGYENSRCYNEMALIKVVQSMTQLARKPVEVFQQEIKEHFNSNGWRLVHRIEYWLETNEHVEINNGHSSGTEYATVQACSSQEESQSEHTVLPDEHDKTLPEHALPESEASAFLGLAGKVKHDLDDSGCGSLTVTLEETHPSDSESAAPSKVVTLATELTTEQKASQDLFQPSVKPKKRRKSYRSFLPEKSGYPDIGFPLFPLSKGFIKSICGVLQVYKAALTEGGILERKDDK